jgi:hypothetical protein
LSCRDRARIRREERPGLAGAVAWTCGVTLALVLTADAGAAVVAVSPALAAAGTEISAHFGDFVREQIGDLLGLEPEPDPCVVWQLARIGANDIVVHGVAPAPGLPCPSRSQSVSLGPLPLRQRFTLEARIVATGALYARIAFTTGFDPLPNTPFPFGVRSEVTVLPAQPAAGSPVSFGLSAWSSSCTHWYFGGPPRIEGDRITIAGWEIGGGGVIGLCRPEPYLYEGYLFTIPGLSPGLKTVEFVEAETGGVFHRLSFTVAEPASHLLLGDRFRVSVAWRDGSGVARAARGRRLTAESAEFTFFDPANVELVVKILDGRGLNGHFWVFAASMTDLPYTLTVTDYLGSYCDIVSPPCFSRVYEGPAGVNRNVIDTQAFAAED